MVPKLLCSVMTLRGKRYAVFRGDAFFSKELGSEFGQLSGNGRSVPQAHLQLCRA